MTVLWTGSPLLSFHSALLVSLHVLSFAQGPAERQVSFVSSPLLILVTNTMKNLTSMPSEVLFNKLLSFFYSLFSGSLLVLSGL